MKKTYSIYEQGVNDPYETKLNLEFDNLKDAQEFCSLKNMMYRYERYFVCINTKYNSLADYAKNNTNKYKSMLTDAIEALEYKIESILNNIETFNVKLKSNKVGRCHNAPLYIIKSVVENGPEKLNKKFYQSNDEITVCSIDYPEYVKVYNKILNDIQNDKKLISKYKKQIKLLTEKQKNETKITTKQEENTL